MAASYSGPLAVGMRVVDKDCFRGVVRYIGPVASSKSADTIYAGVEWDDNTRGKNDGSVVSLADGATVRYFTTKSGAATSASFMKPELLLQGWGMDKALDDRYNDTTDASNNSLIGTSGKAVPVLLVGDEKIRAAQTLGKLTTASLRGCGVASIARGSLTGLCPKMREVDLRSNLLTSWECLAELGAALPNLRTLNLADNPLGPLTAEAVASMGLAGALPQLRTLIVSECGLDWPSVLQLDAVCPNVEELHVCRNGITNTVSEPAVLVAPPTATATATASSAAAAVGPVIRTAPGGASFIPAGLFKALKTLNIGENPLSGWGVAYSFAFLPKLTWLMVPDCGLSELWCEHSSAADLASKLAAAGEDEAAKAAAVAGVPFALLEQLTLTGNAFNAPWCIDALDAFPALTNIRLTNNDLTAAAVTAATLQPAATGAGPAIGPSEARQLVVARCPKLQMVNGSEVRVREREDAEKAYCKKLGGAWAEAHGAAFGFAPPAAGSAAGSDGGAAAGQAAPAAAPAGPARTVQDVFGSKTVVDDATFKGLYTLGQASGPAAGGNAGGLPTTTLTAPSSVGFSKGADSGVIRARPGVDKSNPYYSSPVALWPVSYPAAAAGGEAGAAAGTNPAAAGAPYVPALDPYELGTANKAAAGAIQSVYPRYFMVAAKYDTHAPSAAASGTIAGMAGSAVTLTLRSMAGSSCMMEPAVRKLPLTTAVGAVKQLAARLFKVDPALARLSFRDTGSSYPSLLEDDLKPLSYYAVCEGGEVLIEEVDPAEAARQSAAAAAAQAAREAAQEAQGEALRRAQESSVTAQRRAATVASGAGGGAAKPAGKAKEEDDRI